MSIRRSFRYLVMILTATSAAFMYASRCAINVAILAMVNAKISYEVNSTHSTDNPETTFIDSISSVKKQSAPTFDWNQAQGAIIIGAYFYPYTLMQISSGFLSDKLDVVKFSSVSHLMVTLCIAAIPRAAQSSYFLLLAIRLIMGFCHAPTFPCCYIIFEKWFPPNEKVLAQSIMNVGTNLGVAFAMPISAWICEYYGWPVAFYSVAIANSIFVILWFTLVTADPQHNSFVSDEEKKFIATHVQQIPKRKVKVPWRSMVMSLPLWSVTMAKGINSMGYQSINSMIPLYFKNILGYPLGENGLINASLYVAMAMGQIICGPLSKHIAAKGHLKLTVTRKLFQSIAFIVPAAALLSIPFLSGQAESIITGIVISMFAMGATTGGDVPIIPEMAPGLVGTTYGFANTLSCVAGFLAPITVSFILGDQENSESRWNLVFYFFGSLQIIGAIIFAIFASSKPQSWALVENTTKSSKFEAKEKESNSIAVKMNENKGTKDQVSPL